MLQQLVYVSHARDRLTSILSVSDILDQARRNNVRDGITGALAFTPDRFLQLVEGKPEALDDLLARLAADDRHRGLSIVGRVVVPARAFGGWAMLAPRFTPKNTESLTRLLDSAPADIMPYRDLLLAMAAEQDDGLSTI